MAHRLMRGIKTVRYLGIQKTARFVIYTIAKKSGYFRYTSKHYPKFPGGFHPPAWADCFFPTGSALKASLSEEQINAVLAEAERVLNEKMSAFGWYPMPITFNNLDSKRHWSTLTDSYTNGDDIKLHWESARFSWVFPLIQAYLLTQDEKYPHVFKRYFKIFITQNPLDMGVQWSSGQEVGLRMIAMICAYLVFRKADTWDEAFDHDFLQSIWQHAWRIPPTLIYAKAQNNNHILSEALALFYAGAFFACYPTANSLQEKGWRLFNRTLQKQIQANGTYIQQSMNYHRLMLTEAVWAYKLTAQLNLSFPQTSLQCLNAATTWLAQFTQPENGKVPNLGHNDGSLIFPLGTQAYEDYRPILDTCRMCFAFNGISPKPEYALWLGLDSPSDSPRKLATVPPLPMIQGRQIRVYLRAEHFPDRPAHADQLHTDIWFNGENIAMDAGTYRYTDRIPWQNGLAHTLNHNTLIINHSDQMLWAGRFLWLDWCNGDYLSENTDGMKCIAQHDGYKKFGILHTREIKSDGETSVVVIDSLQAVRKKAVVNTLQLHWLLPDGDWQITAHGIQVTTAQSVIALQILHPLQGEENYLPLSVIRCGHLLHGALTNAFPTLGWASPTYNVKHPALSILVEQDNPVLPFQIIHKWQLKKRQDS